MHMRRATSWLSVIVLLVAACGTSPSPPTASTNPPQPPAGVIVEPECDDTGACGEGFVLGTRAYTLVCVGVKPEQVNPFVVGTGQGKYQEARAIEGLPTSHWVAVRGGDLPCHDDEPDVEWFLAEDQNVGLTPEDVAKLREVTLP